MRKLFALLLLAVPAGCSAGPESQPAAELDTVVSSQEEPLYVDVRTPEEFAAGHVVGAINIPHDQMPGRWPEVAAVGDRPVVVYCRTGRRSGLALDVLRRNGFTAAVNGGGLEDMAAQGLPISR